MIFLCIFLHKLCHCTLLTKCKYKLMFLFMTGLIPSIPFCSPALHPSLIRFSSRAVFYFNQTLFSFPAHFALFGYLACPLSSNDLIILATIFLILIRLASPQCFFIHSLRLFTIHHFSPLLSKTKQKDYTGTERESS